MNATSTVPVRVEGGGEEVVAHVGLHALGCFADRLGLGEALSEAVVAGGDQRVLVHDRGKVLTQMMLVLAGGGQCCADIEYLRSQPGLFGPVPSDSTVWRTFERIDSVTLGYLRQAAGAVRSQVWARSAATTGTAAVTLDLDASLVEIHSEHKDGTGPTYKGGFGFHPMFCFADATGEALSGLLRPGNAGANSGRGPPGGPRHGDRPAPRLGRCRPPARRRPVQRGPSAAGPGRLGRLLGHPRRRVPGTQRRLLGDRPLQPGHRRRDQPGRRRRRDRRLGPRPRTRRQPARPRRGHRGHRPGRPVGLAGGHPADRAPRAAPPRSPDQPVPLPGVPLLGPLHRPSRRPRRLGHRHASPRPPRGPHPPTESLRLERFPFANLDANRAWMATVCLAADLVRWFQLLCLTGPLAAAEPKTLRWALWHTPGRLVRLARRHVVRLLEHWPTTTDLLDAYGRIATIT